MEHQTAHPHPRNHGHLHTLSWAGSLMQGGLEVAEYWMLQPRPWQPWLSWLQLTNPQGRWMEPQTIHPHPRNLGRPHTPSWAGSLMQDGLVREGRVLMQYPWQPWLSLLRQAGQLDH